MQNTIIGFILTKVFSAGSVRLSQKLEIFPFESNFPDIKTAGSPVRTYGNFLNIVWYFLIFRGGHISESVISYL